MALRTAGLLRQFAVTGLGWRFMPTRQLRRFQPAVDRQPKWVTADEAVSVIQSGMTVYIHCVAATPLVLVDAMTKHGIASKLKDVEVIHLHTQGSAEYTKPHCQGIFRSSSVFIGENCREAVNSGRADFIPIFFSEVPLLFERGFKKVDVALVTVSPPDSHGFCTLSTNADITVAAVKTAKHVIGQVNACAPRTFGDGIIHMSQFNALVKADAPLPEMPLREISKNDNIIGKLLADNLIEDGATLQLGIGRIPHSVLSKLKNRRDLGIHSEMISDGVINLFQSGQVTNARKNIQQGKIVCSFAYGTQELYDFMDNNPAVLVGDASWVAETAVIAQNPKVTSINTCIEADLTGQICADSMGTVMYTGEGGQIDFIRGAALGYDGLGKPIIAMHSVTPQGESKIVPTLKPGAGVVTTRAHVHYIVTEYGIAYLFGKTLRQRAYELIRIAHPSHREALEKAAFERLKVMPCRQR